jgi:glycosyl transferase family 25
MFDELEIYVINLDRSFERMERIGERLKKINLIYKRISATDGNKTKFTKKEISPKKYMLAHGKTMTPSEIGCYISHYNVMNEFINNSKKEYALILEDDMVFNEDFINVLEKLLKNKSWDMIKLNGKHKGGNIKLIKINSKYTLTKNLFFKSQSGAYLVNRRAGEKYLKKLLPMFVPLDHEFIKFWKYGIRGFSLYPFPSREENSDSTINYTAIKKNRLTWYLRFPALLYRIYITLCRTLYAIFSSLKFLINKK